MSPSQILALLAISFFDLLGAVALLLNPTYFYDCNEPKAFERATRRLALLLIGQCLIPLIAIMAETTMSLIWFYCIYHVVFLADSIYEYLKKGGFTTFRSNAIFHGISSVVIVIIFIFTNQYIKNWVLIPQALRAKDPLPDELKFLEEWNELPGLGKPSKNLFEFGDFQYLNHGAFGVVPLDILKKMERLEKIRNANPFKFQNYYLPLLLSYGIAALSSFVKSEPELTFFCESVCNGIYNCLMTIMQQKANPRVAYVKGSYVGLASTLESLAAKKMIQLTPFESQQQIDSSKLCSFIQCNNIDVLVLEHITNTTGVLNNVKDLVNQVKSQGVITIIDGAHAPGNIDLDIAGINADFYVGSCYKWLFSLQGCSFVCINKDWQNKFSPPFDTFMKINQLIPFYWRGGINYMPYISCICGISMLKQYGIPQVWQHIKEVKNSIEINLTKEWGAEVISANELSFTVLKVNTNLKKNLNLGVCALEMTGIIAEKLSSQISMTIPSFSEVLVRISLSIYSTADDVSQIQDSFLEIVKQFEN